VNKRPGQIKVTVESGFCSFCDRTRNLRREERQLGALVRTVTSCESCHRVLSSTIGVAEPDSGTETFPEAKPAAANAEPAASTPLTARDTTPKAKAGAKPKAAGKPKAPATRSRPGK
jgi:hypothetical protein